VAHSKNPTIIVSASTDLSVRLWSVNTGVTIAIFAGAMGHRNGVLSVDIHRDFTSLGGVRILSGAMDNTIKVWGTPPLTEAIATASTWKKPLADFKTVFVETPMFSSSRVHEDYVDCVGWLGDTVVSKSVDGKVKLWAPDAPNGVVHARGTQFRLISQFPLEHANLWWIKFGISASRNVLACGNMRGSVVAWRLDVDDPLAVSPHRLKPLPTVGHSTGIHEHFKSDDKGPSVVRQCAVSADGAIVVAACDNGFILRWDACHNDDNTVKETTNDPTSFEEDENNTTTDLV
jgi:polycomb protein EED